jgi:Gly-Xaa carboxypeptidase
MKEKQPDYTLLPQGEATALTAHQYSRSNRRRTWHWAVCGALVTALILATIILQTGLSQDALFSESNALACPQYAAFKSTTDERRKLEEEMQGEFDSDGFFDKSLKRLQGAVQIPTEVFDDMGEVGEDPRWYIFGDFHAYLEKTFPLV